MGTPTLEKWKRRMDVLSDRQKHVVREVLHYLVDDPKVDGPSDVKDVSRIRMALANYWDFQGLGTQ